MIPDNVEGGRLEVAHRLHDVQHRASGASSSGSPRTCRRRSTTSGVSEGMVLVSAMHITAAVWVNDDEPGLQEDTLEWLDKVAPPSWKEPANDVARQLLPDPRRLPPPPRRRGQRRRPPEEPAGAPPGGPADHRRQARPRAVAGGLLLRVRRPPLEAAGDQGDGRLMRGCAGAKRGATRLGRPQRPAGADWRAPAMVIGAVVSVQLGSAAATTLFDQVGPAGAVLYRLLLRRRSCCWRSGARTRSRQAGTGCCSRSPSASTLAGMNLCFYESLDRIPLGIAVTFEFVGPLLVGLFGFAAAARPRLGGMRRRRSPAARRGPRGPRAPRESASRCSPAASGPPTSCSARGSAASSRAAGDWPSRWVSRPC